VRLVSRFSLAAALLTIAIVFGGGGSPAPIPELFVQIAALLALGAWLYLPESQPAERQTDYPLWIGAGLFAAIPLVQLLPLPPDLWHALPGREAELAALSTIGAGSSWRPISVAPYQTLASALSLIPPGVMLYFAYRLSPADRTRLVAVAAGLALLSAVIGVIQVASGSADWPRFYQYSNVGRATGFQDNRNGTADIFLIGLLAIFAFAAAHRTLLDSALAKAMAVATAAFLCLSVVLTGSRTGTALVLICLVFAVLIVRPRVRLTRNLLIATAGCIAILGVVGYSLRDNSALNRTWSRFENVADTRPRIWEDTRFAVGQYWPLGAGIGTFTTVFPTSERLEGVHSSVTNRAHQDYLEFALETGIVGMILLVGAFLALGYRIFTIIHHARDRLAAIHGLFAVGAVTILALHSLVDYPMRSMSLSVMAAFSLALLSRPSGRNDATGNLISSGRIREATE
jgi:exopolysaccharide production protein ExoQ